MTNIPFYWVVILLVAASWGVYHLVSLPELMSKILRVQVNTKEDLIRACHGDRSQAERLINHEITRKPKLSYKAAAKLALSKLRDDLR